MWVLHVHSPEVALHCAFFYQDSVYINDTVSLISNESLSRREFTYRYLGFEMRSAQEIRDLWQGKVVYETQEVNTNNNLITNAIW